MDEFMKGNELASGIGYADWYIFPKVAGDVLLIGVCYDAKNKKHTCKIEKWDELKQGKQLWNIPRLQTCHWQERRFFGRNVIVAAKSPYKLQYTP